MLMAPSSHASRLQPPTHRSEVGQTLERGLKKVQDLHYHDILCGFRNYSTHHSASKAQWIVAEDRPGRAVVVLA